MADGQIDEAVIRSRVEKRLKQQRGFSIHLGVYITVHLFLWLVWFIATRAMESLGFRNEFPFNFAYFPWPLLIMFGWGIGIVAHGMRVYFGSGAAAAARERAIQREIALERERYGLEEPAASQEKPKRKAKREEGSGRVQLSEDGELIFEDEDEVQSARRGG